MVEDAVATARRGARERRGKELRVGDRVSWASEAGRVRGVVRRKIAAPMRFKTYTVRASIQTPQYLIESEKTGHLAMHKGTALRRLAPHRASKTSRHSRASKTSRHPRRSS